LSSLVYLYGFVPAATAPPPPLAGIADAPVDLLAVDGAAAVVSAAPEADYEAAAIEARLEDLEWVAAQGLAHEQVVAWFVDHADIAPAPLFTIYSSADALRDAAAANRARIAAQLARCTGRREWDVKLGADPAKLAAGVDQLSEPLRALDREIAAAAPGRRFLLERRRAELVRDEVRRLGRESAQHVLDALRPAAEDVVTLAVPAATSVLLHAAVLVARGNEAELRRRYDAAVGPLAGAGFDASLTGPWAPYRFMGGVDG
jgi:hypothetical protein